MKRLIQLPALLLAATLAWTSLGTLTYAQTEAPAPAAPQATVEERRGAIEAYFANSDPSLALKDEKGDIPKGLTTPAVGVPGAGHNGFMMICAALVLFMTLPGLALFYGGLVRRKNVLSVLAQCLGCAGMITVLWWA